MDSTTTAPAAPPTPLTAHLTSASDSGESYTPPTGIHLGREQVKWNEDVWERIDRAVHDESQRTRVAAKFLPQYRVDPHTTTVPADTVLGLPTSSVTTTPLPMNIDEGSFIRLVEIWVEFSLTAAQVQKESELLAGQPGKNGQQGDHAAHPASTAVTLARRATNTLGLAQDTVIFQGLNAFYPLGKNFPLLGSNLFSNGTVQSRAGNPPQLSLLPLDGGLLCLGGTNNIDASSSQVLKVNQITPPAPPAPQVVAYSTNTVAQIDAAVAYLASTGYAGPYVTVLHFYPYADSMAPIANTLILPADRIKPLMEAGYFSSSTIGGLPNQNPPNPPQLTGSTPPQAYGLVISLGGNTVDLVNGLDPVTAFSLVDSTGNFTFRVLTRFALRLKDSGSVIRLEFQ